MFNLFNKKPVKNSQKFFIALKNLHCSSCAVNIDLVLEELPGVISSQTNYAKSQVTVLYEETKIKPETILAEIAKLGYR